MDTNLLKNKETSLNERLLALRGQEDVLVRASAIEEQAVKAETQANAHEDKAKELRQNLKKLRDEKAQALATSLDTMREKMGQVLPSGKPRFEIEDDGSVVFGWEMGEGRYVPYGGLSGGQKVQFDAALGYAMLDKAALPILLVEAAELGAEIGGLLRQIEETSPNAQVIVNTCLSVQDQDVPETWKMHYIGGK